jgi:hypothetical protein
VAAGITNWRTAWTIYYTYIRNGYRLRSPAEVSPQKLTHRPKLEPHKDYLLSRIYEWRFETLA